MGAFFLHFVELLKGLRLWIVVSPWEKAIVVRCGRYVRCLVPGIHLCIPLLDKANIQNSRLRVINVPTQTLSTRDHKTIIVGGTVAFRVADLLILLSQLQQPEDGLVELTQERVARCVTTTSSGDLSCEGINRQVNSELDGAKYGLSDLRFYVTDYAYTRTIRLIMDQRYGSWGDRIQLDTKIES